MWYTDVMRVEESKLRLARTIERAIADKKAAKAASVGYKRIVAVLRLKPFARIELEDDRPKAPKKPRSANFRSARRARKASPIDGSVGRDGSSPQSKRRR